MMSLKMPDCHRRTGAILTIKGAFGSKR
jgi:hypothetical protein